MVVLWHIKRVEEVLAEEIHRLAQAGVRPAVGVITEFRRKTSPRPRAFRLPAAVVVGEAGRRARSFVREPRLGYN